MIVGCISALASVILRSTNGSHKYGPIYQAIVKVSRFAYTSRCGHLVEGGLLEVRLGC